MTALFITLIVLAAAALELLLGIATGRRLRRQGGDHRG